MGLITLPVVIANARVRRRSFLEILHRVARPSTSGVPIMAMVSFMRSAARMPVPKSMRSTSWSGFLAWEKKRLEIQAR
jgi:hypothetical protein